jgi:ribonuclease BN (tRNA processing enzyme)
MRFVMGLVLVALASISIAEEDCPALGVRLQVLGSGGPELDDGRASASYLVWRGDRALLLVDAGTGSALHFEEAGASFTDLRAVLLTHLHVDHSADLPAYVKGGYFTSRSNNLQVFGPSANSLMPATSAYLEALIGSGGAFSYLADHLEPESKSAFKLVATDVPVSDRNIRRYALEPGLTVAAVPVHHGPVAALAWRVDIGACAITFSGDMSGDYNTLPALAKGTDLLVMHNAVPEDAAGVALRLHMLPSEIGQLARSSGARQVLLSHRMKRTLGVEQETLSQIREHYQGPVAFAEDLQVVEL